MSVDILAELRKRKSPLVFAEKDVEKEKIETLVEAARWAPSCSNNQPWNYVFVHKDSPTRRAFEEALSLGNGWAKKAPYLVAVGANPDEDCKNNGLPYYAYDAGLSVMCLTVEAEHQGLRVHQMAGWNEPKVKKALGFPESYRVVVVFALGYEGDVKRVWDKLEQRIKDRLAEPRKRKPTSENFFSGSFGNAYNPESVPR
jgi:nitroreductase